MAVPTWQPSTLYVPGALVTRLSAAPAPPTATAIVDPDLEGGGTGWTFDSGVRVNVGYAYTGTHAIEFYAIGGHTRAIAQRVAVVAGVTIKAQCMYQQGSAPKNHNNGCVILQWFDAGGSLLHEDGGNAVISSSGGWQLSAVTATAPANAASVAIGVYSFRDKVDTSHADCFSWNYTPPAAPQSFMYEAVQTDAGLSGASEPAWPATLGATVTDNAVTWKAVAISRITWQASPLLTSGATEPTWPAGLGGTVHDGTIDWVAKVPVVTDPHAPSSPVATIGASKIFVGSSDIVRFCATNNATDWTAQYDAGFLPTGLQSPTETDCAALGLYRGNLAVFMDNALQVWQIDPDPAQMSFMDQVPGIGTTFGRALCPMEGDLYFLSPMGVRSCSISAGTANLSAGDIGTPIDPLVRADLAAYAVAKAGPTPPAWEPIGINFPSGGQFLLFLGDHAWVFTYSPAAQLAAWSQYTLPWVVTDACVLEGDVYVRADDHCVYRLDKEFDIAGHDATDDTATDAQAYTTTVRWPYLDFGNGGGTVDTYGADVLFTEGASAQAGVTALSLGWDENDVAAMTEDVVVSAVQARGRDGFVPMETSSPSVSLQVTYVGNGAWELTQANIYIGGGPRAP